MLKEILIGGLLAATMCGCSSVRPGPSAVSTVKPTKLQIRNNAASLLSDLLNDEQNVDKVLIVKNASLEIKSLIKLIAATAAAHNRELDQMATNDPTLHLDATDLPPGETATRDATAKAQEHALLFSTGVNFEFNLLYCQAEAQNYGRELAGVAAKNCERPEEATRFEAISKSMEHLNDEVLSTMRSLPPD